MNDPTSETAVPSPKRRKILRALGEIALVAAVIAFAAWQLRVTPSLAAAAQQESPKYAIGAWNLYKTGHYAYFINHREYPAWGGLGYAALIVPSFWLFGDFIGNAIYTQWLLAVLVCVGIYIAVRMTFGIWPAFVAAILTAIYPIFGTYTRQNDLSVPLAFFLVAGLLIFLWILRSERSQFWKWLLWGLCAGWAVAVHPSAVIVFAALTVTLLWLSKPRRKSLLINLFAAAIGAAILLTPVLLFNQHYCGSPFRDAHAYWESSHFDNLRDEFRLRYAFGMPDYKLGNDKPGGNALFYLAEIATQFTEWRNFWKTPLPSRATIFCLAAFAVIGLFLARRRAQTNKAGRHFWWFAIVAIISLLTFYSTFKARNDRYLLPIAPLVAAFVGIGAVELIRLLARRKLTWILIPLVTGTLIAPLYFWCGNVAFQAGDILPTTDILQKTDKAIEPNAVVVTAIFPPLVEHFVIRDTQRVQIPLKEHTRWRVFPKPSAPVDIFGFSATGSPEIIRRLLELGLPVYVIDQSFGHVMNKDLQILAEHFDFEHVGTLTPKGALQMFFPNPGPFLIRLKLKQADSTAQ